MIKIQLMDWIFSYLSIMLIKWVDPIKKSDFEKQLVLINLVFIIINHFGIFGLILVYLRLRFNQCSVLMVPYDKVYDKVKLQIGLVNQVEQSYFEFQNVLQGCFQEVRTFFASYIIMNFLLSIIRVCYMKIRVKKFNKKFEAIKVELMKAAEKKDHFQIQKQKTKMSLMKSQKEEEEVVRANLDQTTFQAIPETEETVQGLRVQENTSKAKPSEVKAFDHNMFKKYYYLNSFIENEIYLENWNLSDDVDSTVRHFNQIFVMYTALTLFGMFFPASFFLYYFALIMEVYIDQQEFLFICRRPSPKETNSIGFFKYFMIICPSLSIITISFYLSFSLLRITLNINYIYMSFLFVFMSGIIIFQLVFQINPKGTEKMKDLIQRQKYLCKHIFYEHYVNKKPKKLRPLTVF